MVWFPLLASVSLKIWVSPYHSFFMSFVYFLPLHNTFHLIFVINISINCSKYVLFCGIPMFFHGTIIRTGITCKKLPCYILVGDLLLKKLNYFKVMLNIFEFSRVWENVVLISLSKSAFSNCSAIFLDERNKRKLVLASFSCF